jgi:ribose-phosphate pyrophosphokinase
MKKTDFKLFSGSASFSLAQRVAQNLEADLAQAEVFKFSNQETRVRIIDDVGGKTCFILQSLGTPTDENWAELLFFLDALKRSRAKKIIGVIPWLGYQKQDKQFRNGEAVSVAVVIKTLEASGMDKAITIDLHSRIILSYFQRKPIVLSAFPLFLEEIKKIIKQKESGFVMVAPDEGAYWAKDFSRKLKIDFATVTKERNKNTAEIPYDSLRIEGEVKNKTAIIVDNNIYTGSTLICNAKFLKAHGAQRVICFVTHPILSPEAPALLEKSEIDALTVTDTIFVPKKKLFPKLKIISVAPLLAKTILSAVL